MYRYKNIRRWISRHTSNLDVHTEKELCPIEVELLSSFIDEIGSSRILIITDDGGWSTITCAMQRPVAHIVCCYMGARGNRQRTVYSKIETSLKQEGKDVSVLCMDDAYLLASLNLHEEDWDFILVSASIPHFAGVLSLYTQKKDKRPIVLVHGLGKQNNISTAMHCAKKNRYHARVCMRTPSGMGFLFPFAIHPRIVQLLAPWEESRENLRRMMTLLAPQKEDPQAIDTLQITSLPQRHVILNGTISDISFVHDVLSSLISLRRQGWIQSIILSVASCSTSIVQELECMCTEKNIRFFHSTLDSRFSRAQMVVEQSLSLEKALRTLADNDFVLRMNLDAGVLSEEVLKKILLQKLPLICSPHIAPIFRNMVWIPSFYPAMPFCFSDQLMFGHVRDLLVCTTYDLRLEIYSSREVEKGTWAQRERQIRFWGGAFAHYFPHIRSYIDVLPTITANRESWMHMMHYCFGHPQYQEWLALSLYIVHHYFVVGTGESHDLSHNGLEIHNHELVSISNRECFVGLWDENEQNDQHEIVRTALQRCFAQTGISNTGRFFATSLREYLSSDLSSCDHIVRLRSSES